jgi:hypothetical protein
LFVVVVVGFFSLLVVVFIVGRLSGVSVVGRRRGRCAARSQKKTKHTKHALARCRAAVVINKRTKKTQPT